jgi:hypothetical protein
MWVAREQPLRSDPYGFVLSERIRHFHALSWRVCLQESFGEEAAARSALMN